MLSDPAPADDQHRRSVPQAGQPGFRQAKGAVGGDGGVFGEITGVLKQVQLPDGIKHRPVQPAADDGHVPAGPGKQRLRVAAAPEQPLRGQTGHRQQQMGDGGGEVLRKGNAGLPQSGGGKCPGGTGSGVIKKKRIHNILLSRQTMPAAVSRCLIFCGISV